MPDGALLAAGAYDTILAVWDVGRNKKLGTLEYKERLNAIRFANEGLRLAIAGTCTVQVWTVAECSTIETVIHEHTAPCTSVKFSPDGETLAAGYWTGGIRLWDVEHLEPLVTFPDGDSDLIRSRSIDFSPGGNKLAFSSYDTTVKVWDIGRPDAPITEFKGHQKAVYAVAFSPKEIC